MIENSKEVAGGRGRGRGQQELWLEGDGRADRTELWKEVGFYFEGNEAQWRS